ncbi:hypothetical protein GCK72_020398 [Caenorhabditis remanei]|uniref:BTB domain-containing protein n=1 Tax=Caenorhabditis remanei TaxID=31234 RepID=A0A6A5GGV9_CAERE|nr:hypothetical protein GCK72_020398 [Caenorhabditis remanei]KAF1753841.1 hypothetical protein GCK72_020398 [Caenorhabditis remanei]
MTSIERKFTVKHVFTDFIKSTSDGNEMNGKPEKHFGCTWHANVLPSYSRSGNQVDHYFISLYLENHRKSEEWRIGASCELMFETAKGPKSIENDACEFPHSENNFIFELKGEDLRKYLIDGKLGVEFHVSIDKITGMQLFDESMRKYSDVVLIVEDQKFYVLKFFLASQSSYFDTLFFGNFEESAKSEITLTGIEASQFQNFLEALHGHSVIDDKTVEGVLNLANMYDAQTVFQRCQTFLLKESKKCMKEKLELAGKFQLPNLKKDCLSKINTFEEIRAVVPHSSESMDHHILAKLFDKLIEVQKPSSTSFSFGNK